MANQTGIRTSSAFTAIASEKFIPKFVSDFYTFSPLLSALTRAKGSDRDLRPAGDKETPGSVRSTFIGGSNIGYAQKMQIRGSLTASWSVMTGTAGGVKNLSARDTSAQLSNPTTNSQDNKEVMTYLNFSLKQVECVIWNNSLRLGRGQYKITSSLEHATGIAMQDLLDSMIEELWIGSPSDQTAPVWDSQCGVNHVCSETNTLYGLDRSADDYFHSHRVATALAPTLSLVENANVTQGIRGKSTRGVTFGLANANSYLALKAEATTKGLGAIIQEGNPIAARYGILNEAIAYGNTVITYDPGLKNYGASESGAPDMSDDIVFFDLGDWFFETQEGENFSVGEFIDISQYVSGGYDARRALITVMYRLGCYQPKNQIIYDNINVV